MLYEEKKNLKVDILKQKYLPVNGYEDIYEQLLIYLTSSSPFKKLDENISCNLLASFFL